MVLETHILHEGLTYIILVTVTSLWVWLRYPFSLSASSLPFSLPPLFLSLFFFFLTFGFQRFPSLSCDLSNAFKVTRVVIYVGFSFQQHKPSQQSTYYAPRSEHLNPLFFFLNALKSFIHPWSLLFSSFAPPFFYSISFILMQSLEKGEINVCVCCALF